MTDDEAWRADANQQAINGTFTLLLEWLYTMYFDSRPEGGKAAFDNFERQVRALLEKGEPIDVVTDRTQALVSDLSRQHLSQFLDRVKGRM